MELLSGEFWFYVIRGTFYVGFVQDSKTYNVLRRTYNLVHTNIILTVERSGDSILSVVEVL